MLYEILGLTTTFLNPIIKEKIQNTRETYEKTKKDYSHYLEAAGNVIIYYSLYYILKETAPKEVFETYLLLTPTIFSLNIIAEYLKQKEQKNHEKTKSDLEKRVKELE